MTNHSPQPNLTRQQAEAIAAHDRSTALAAGAGCGKTLVLTERFLSYLDPRTVEPSAELHELVAITFTDAAAREMRDRVRRRCYDQLRAESDSSVASAWQNLLRSIDSARISTIHSFCTSLLRKHAVEAGLDPQFEVLDAAAADVLKLQTVDDVLRRSLLAEDERLMQLVQRFRLGPLREHLLLLLDRRTTQAFESWQDQSAADVLNAWNRFFAEEAQPEARRALLESLPLVQLRNLLHDALVENPVENDELREHLGRLLAMLDELQSEDACQPALDELIKLARTKGPCKKGNWTDPERYGNFRDICTEVRKLAGKSILGKSLETDAAEQAAEVGLALLQLAAEVSDAYEQVLSSRQALEYDDLLAKTHRLLTDPQHQALCDNLAGGVKLLLVDEFQDTNPLQVAIIQAFCGNDWAERGLFVVGDHKQSIYRFTGAQPKVSRDLQAALPDQSRLSLTINFRSQPAILDFVNALFWDAFEQDYQPLEPSRPQMAPTPSIEFLWAVAEEKNVQQARALEARFIAGRLAQLLDSGEPIVVEAAQDGAHTTRPVRLGDIALLFRSLTDVALYEEALREQGLDYYLAGGHAFYAQQEIYDILNLLRAVASSADDLSLAGALRSPLFALKDESLYWLVQTGGSLNGGLFAEKLPSQLDAVEREKVRRAASTLQWLRAGKDRWLVGELLQNALARTGYDAAVLCEFLGQRKLANLQKLVEQARTVDRTSPGDLHAFIIQLSQFVARAPKEPLAATQAEGDAIRIMTIHHAKGLEFPVVVVPDLNRGLTMRPPAVALDEQLGPLVRAVEDDQFVGLQLFQHRDKLQELEERKRLLYVACTRAADYLILSSSIADIKKPKSDWLEMLGNQFDLQNGSLLGTLPAGYNAPEIRVTTAEPETDRKQSAGKRGADLLKLVAGTRQTLSDGKGRVPVEVAPVPVDGAARRRFSFSRLTGGLVEKSPGVATPGLEIATPGLEHDPADHESSSTTLDPRGLGTLVHAVLERVDFRSPTDIKGLCEYLAPQHLEQQADAAAAEAAAMVDQFLGSARAQQIAQAKIVRKEVEFVVPWSVKGPWPIEEERFAGRYLHGFIDCLYQDAAGGWYLLDYKTNNVRAENIADAAEHYRMQMYVYGLACRQALGREPSECVLHFLRPGVDFAFPWDDANQRDMAAKIDAAIEAMTMS